jgi:hypothetical protein
VESRENYASNKWINAHIKLWICIFCIHILDRWCNFYNIWRKMQVFFMHSLHIHYKKNMNNFVKLSVFFLFSYCCFFFIFILSELSKFPIAHIGFFNIFSFILVYFITSVWRRNNGRNKNIDTKASV